MFTSHEIASQKIVFKSVEMTETLQNEVLELAKTVLFLFIIFKDRRCLCIPLRKISQNTSNVSSTPWKEEYGMLLLEKNLDPILPMTEIVSFTFRLATILFLYSVLANLFITIVSYVFFYTQTSLCFPRTYILTYSIAGGWGVGKSSFTTGRIANPAIPAIFASDVVSRMGRRYTNESQARSLDSTAK